MIPVAEANEQTEKPKSLLDQYIENASRLKKVDAQDETKLDKDRLDKAISDEKKRQRDGEQGTRDKLSEEDLEAYRLVRMRPDDPMAEYMS